MLIFIDSLHDQLLNHITSPRTQAFLHSQFRESTILTTAQWANNKKVCPLSFVLLSLLSTLSVYLSLPLLSMSLAVFCDLCVSVYKCVPATSAPEVNTAQISHQEWHHKVFRLTDEQTGLAITLWQVGSAQVCRSESWVLILGNLMKAVTMPKGTTLYFNNCCDLCKNSLDVSPLCQCVCMFVEL